MKKEKRFISLLLTAFILISMFGISITSQAATVDDPLDYLQYEINGGKVTITICDDSISGDLVIPSAIEGYPVTTIRKYDFYCCDRLTNVTIPNSVVTIGDYAFGNKNENGNDNKIAGFKIYCYAGTAGEKYAIDNGFDYMLLKNKVTSVSIDDITLNYKKSTTLNSKVGADEGVNYTVKYKSSDTGVATVDENGNVYAAKGGNATITCTVTDEYGNSVSDTCNIKVDYNFGQLLIIIFLFGWIWYI